MATPGKLRQSAIPAPGRASSIPTPGRPRSSSSVYQPITTSTDSKEISRAFADALRANDPANHRVMTHNVISTSSSLSPKSASLAPSGRRSVAGRPSSSASGSSAFSASTRAGAKTPVSARAPSRHSDLHTNTKSRTFEEGDNVRIESLGFEGTLRYLGEIEGKPGQWAGVELSGGFVGKGKNDGSVNGVRYFECPLSCGVFVAVSKLSPPTVGVGAVQQRPPSVASTRNGRVTPAMSGRMTPSFSTSSYSKTPSYSRTPSASFSRTPSASFGNGRITPANGNGRITPSISTSRITATTPSAKPRSSTVPKPLPITVGSRASKYASMTAKDLNNSKSGRPPASPIPSPKTSRINGSPTRPPGSPFTTPKALTTSKLGGGIGFGKGRPSGSTPRARVPSNVSMPPPASPFSKSAVQNGHDDDFGEPESISRFQLFGDTKEQSRPGSSASVRSSSTDDGLLERLRSRLDALEYENERLRVSAVTTTTVAAPVEPETTPVDSDLDKEIEGLRNQNTEATSEVARLTQELKDAQSLVTSQQEELTSLNGSLATLRGEMDESEKKHQEVVKGLQSEKEIMVTELERLKNSVSEQETSYSELEETLRVKDADITALKSQLAAVNVELEQERKELGTQIDELRIAGQETIALYEERLSEVEDQRYDLESRLNSLHEKIAAQDQPAVTPRVAETAAEIDNETLREQVHHLQKKIASMEDIMEDQQANAEKENVAYRERMKRLKEKEDAMKKELSEGKMEVERVVRAEGQARHRVEEIEEALRESTFALENARAEIEALRSELTNLEGLVEGTTDGGDLSTRITEFTRRMGQEREQNEKEIEQLKARLRTTRDTSEIQSELDEITAQLNQARLEVEDRDRDLREMKKRLRDVPVVNGALDTSKGLSPTSSKNDLLNGGKEEVTGLKHIVQELQKEISSSLSKIKMLESENDLLRSEAEQLRQEVHILEENLDNSLQNDDISGSFPDDASVLQKRAKEQALEIEQLRKKHSDVEMKHGRTIHDLNKEIGELEALVESKIYREDELEQEIERLKEKISRARKPKTSVEPANRLSSASSTASSEVQSSDRQVCEICERPGHDIFNCDLLKEETSSVGSASPGVVCEDCETPGHVASDCPYAQDVF